jgi:hypothetical protein
VSAQPDSSALQSELSLVIQASEFVRSPVLRKLLEYLVAQTIAGNGGRLKAYQIAVEGLGRDDNFDPQSDSYPRVQVGRLRKMLDAHYAALPETQARGRRRIVIPVGQYEVLLQPITPHQPDVAAPAPTAADAESANAAPLQPSVPGFAADAAVPAPAPSVAAPAAMDRGWVLWVFRALLLLSLVYIIWLLARPDDADRDSSLRDIHSQIAHVNISTTPKSGNDDLNTAAQIAEMHLQRFEMVVVSMDDGSARPPILDTTRQYQLVLRGAVRNAKSGLVGPMYLTLRHSATGATLWSSELRRTANGDHPDVEQAIANGISRIARSGGLIAQHQRRLIGTDMSAGYPCLIQYDAFRNNRDPAQRAPLKACLTQSLKRFPNEPLVLQALSYLALSAPEPGQRRPLSPSAEGRKFATEALQHDGGSALAQIAVARSSLARGNCSRAIAFARRAVESNPLEPDTLGVAGSFLMSCGDFAGAEPVLESAMAMSTEPDGYQTASLIITRLINGKRKEALDLALTSDSQAMFDQPNFLLAKSLALAANGNGAAARQTWSALEKSVGVMSGTPVADVLAKFTLSPRFALRMRAEAERLGLAPTTGGVAEG